MKDLDYLIDQLHQAKSEESSAKEKRMAIENAILKHHEIAPNLKPEGTTSFKALGLSVVTGFTRSWDGQQLETLQSGIKPEFFPFKQELKEDRKASKIIEERFPDLWGKLSKALTLKPKKPSLTLKNREPA